MSSEAALLAPTDGAEKLVHLALPVRIAVMSGNERMATEMACTYDIHPRGARILSSREVNIGDILHIERGRNKAVCRVIWTADSTSTLRGQFTVECIDQVRAPWEDELRQVQEQFFPVLSEDEIKSSTMTRRTNENKRRRPRFSLEGSVDLVQLDGRALKVEGKVKQLSELGCRIVAEQTLLPGANLKVALNVFNVSMALRGQVKYSGDQVGMGVEFTDIRQGDRPLLSYVLAALNAQQKAEIKPAAVAAGS